MNKAKVLPFNQPHDAKLDALFTLTGELRREQPGDWKPAVDWFWNFPSLDNTVRLVKKVLENETEGRRRLIFTYLHILGNRDASRHISDLHQLLIRYRNQKNEQSLRRVAETAFMQYACSPLTGSLRPGLISSPQTQEFRRILAEFGKKSFVYWASFPDQPFTKTESWVLMASHFEALGDEIQKYMW